MLSSSCDKGGLRALWSSFIINNSTDEHETENCDENNFPSFLTLASFFLWQNKYIFVWTFSEKRVNEILTTIVHNLSANYI